MVLALVLSLISIPVPAAAQEGKPFTELQRQIDDLSGLQRQIDELTDAVAGLAGAPIAVTVDCDAGQTISNALQAPPGPLTVHISGTCRANVVITRDNVTLVGRPGASITAAIDSSPAILIDTARLVRIFDVAVHGGAGAVVGSRNATYELNRCSITGARRFGVVASYGAVGIVDSCVVSGTDGDGMVAANTGSLVVTNSTIERNTGTGLTAIRSAQLRIGQDFGGTASHPVTIRGNGGSGVTVTESSAGIVIASAVIGNGGNGISVTRASSAQIGVGSGGLEVGVQIQSNASEGILIEGANATILGSTIGGSGAGAGNGRSGIVVTNGGSARIGIRNDSSSYVGNTITNNKRDGITVSSGGAAIIGGNTISDNGKDPAVAFRFGVLVSRATAVFPGGNTISNHPNSGVFAGGGATVRIGDPGFGPPVVPNTISGNGHDALDGSTRGGIFAFQGGVIETRGAIIQGNHGQGGFAFEGGIIELREGTLVQNNLSVVGGPGNSEGGNGLVASLRSTLRLRDVGTTISGNQGDGVLLFSGSVVDFRNTNNPTPVVVVPNAGLSLRCVGINGGNTFFSGDTRGLTGGIACASF